MTATEQDWISALRAACTARGSSQRKVAAELGYSTSVINQVLSGKYNGDWNAVQTKVEGLLLGISVECPVVGELPRNRCLDYQRRGFAATNHIRVRLARACPTCPHRRGGAE